MCSGNLRPATTKVRQGPVALETVVGWGLFLFFKLSSFSLSRRGCSGFDLQYVEDSSDTGGI